MTEWIAVVALLGAISLAVIWLAAALGMVTRSVEGASTCRCRSSCCRFLGSGFVPTDSLPTAPRWFAECQPLTPMMETLRAQ